MGWAVIVSHLSSSQRPSANHATCSCQLILKQCANELCPCLDYWIGQRQRSLRDERHLLNETFTWSIWTGPKKFLTLTMIRCKRTLNRNEYGSWIMNTTHAHTLRVYKLTPLHVTRYTCACKTQSQPTDPTILLCTLHWPDGNASTPWWA